jgi:hypothetical protein
MNFTDDEIIKELQRELRLRNMLYPRWVNQGRFTQATADRNIALLETAIARINYLKDHD